MDWLEVKTANNERILINANSIMRVGYNEDTNLTIVEFTRSAYPAVYVRGNIMMDIKRILSSHDYYVTRIGD